MDTWEIIRIIVILLILSPTILYGIFVYYPTQRASKEDIAAAVARVEARLKENRRKYLEEQARKQKEQQK